MQVYNIHKQSFRGNFYSNEHLIMALKRANNLEKITKILQGTNYLSRFRLIPFSAVGRKNGMLVGFRVDKVKVISDELEIEKKKVIVGLYDNSLSQGEKYNALIGMDLIS